MSLQAIRIEFISISFQKLTSLFWYKSGSSLFLSLILFRFRWLFLQLWNKSCQLTLGDESLVKFLKTSDEEKFKCATMRRGSVIKRTFLGNQIARLSSIYGSLIAFNSVDYESLESSKLHSDWFREITFSRFIKIKLINLRALCKKFSKKKNQKFTPLDFVQNCLRISKLYLASLSDVS